MLVVARREVDHFESSRHVHVRSLPLQTGHCYSCGAHHAAALLRLRATTATWPAVTNDANTRWFVRHGSRVPRPAPRVMTGIGYDVGNHCRQSRKEHRSTRRLLREDCSFFLSKLGAASTGWGPRTNDGERATTTPRGTVTGRRQFAPSPWGTSASGGAAARAARSTLVPVLSSWNQAYLCRHINGNKLFGCFDTLACKTCQ
jgi:hypothetical protein